MEGLHGQLLKKTTVKDGALSAAAAYTIHVIYHEGDHYDVFKPYGHCPVKGGQALQSGVCPFQPSQAGWIPWEWSQWS